MRTAQMERQPTSVQPDMAIIEEWELSIYP